MENAAGSKQSRWKVLPSILNAADATFFEFSDS